MKIQTTLISAFAAVFLLAACGPQEGSTPTVLSNSPEMGAVDVPINAAVKVTFSEPMDRATLTPDTFVVTTAEGAAVSGKVTYSNSVATFWPAAHLASNGSFKAKVTTGAKTEGGVALASDRAWDFKTGSTLAAVAAVNLGTAGDFVILAKSGISTVPTSTVTGNLGVSPAAASSITGFSLSADSTNVFSTSPQVTGKIYAADYTPPAPTKMTTAVSDMELAFTDSAARAPDATELGAGNIGGMTLAPGVYKWGTGLLIPTNVTLSGNGTAVWIFQIAQDLTVSSGARIVLSGGAQAKNIFWQFSGSADINTTAHMEGILLSQTAITLRTGASLNGRLLAQTAVSLDGNVVTAP